MSEKELTHIDHRGQASMVDVGHKPPMRRKAIAHGLLTARQETLERLFAGDLPKGEGLAVARIAGIQAAKRCDELIPLCHTLPLDAVAIEFDRPDPTTVRVVATAATTARTGVEMEALIAASTALLTIWDMLKAIDTDLAITSVELVEKTKEAL